VHLQEKKKRFEGFWNGEGPSLILVPSPQPDPAETVPYPETFADPALMWNAEMVRARPVLDWPTDGIPTIRPNLGVVFLPSIAGLGYRLQDDQMPWPGDPLPVETIRGASEVDVAQAGLMLRARRFYEIHRDSSEKDRVVPYLPDTQGVFDVAHLLYGDSLFYDASDRAGREWIHELMGICMDLFKTATRYLKDLLGQPSDGMIHGHGTPQGVYFPRGGARICEDTATLFSPAHIDEFIMPYVECAVAPFAGGFAHYCGRHDYLLERLCRCPLIHAVDLQPGMHDIRWTLERCAETGTVLFSGVEALEGEDWRVYIQRLAQLLKETGARCILRPTVFPTDKDECAEMQEMWHELTA
jgi:hypothetical protein